MSKLESWFEYEPQLEDIKLDNFTAKHNSEHSIKYRDFIVKQFLSLPNFTFTHFLKTCLHFLKCEKDEFSQSMNELDKESKKVYDDVFMNLIYFFMTGHYDDLLGLIHMELIGQKQAQSSGQFYTPWEVAKLMAEL